MTCPAAPLAYDKLSRRRLRERLSRYGFVECCMLICFLDMCCSDRLGMGELFYIRSKIRECLWNHDEGSAWFDDLRLMESDVSRSLALQHKKHHSGYPPDAFTSGCTCS
ncbi:hypothetical protein QE443_000054 [Pantoea ananatis]|nr:hypothetical protein [Pantoea ananatis]MDR6092653.1 hypothetical protein [Pantoea ananatis]NQE78357.1 hypothetical protein [Pantoea ananatis]NQE83149.1 hypothetical protein [Pantoea ananatis]PQK93856.1 hypothetical protein CG434_23270 [Pantoea ananatis]